MTDELKINGKALYTTKGAAREYGRIGCNFYIGCPHNCTYCYLKRGAPSKQLGGTEVRLKKCFKDEMNAMTIFARETLGHLEQCRRHGIFFSFTTDPMLRELQDAHLTKPEFLDCMCEIYMRTILGYCKAEHLDPLETFTLFHQKCEEISLKGHDEAKRELEMKRLS